MVQRLADRLADEPDDFEGWARLANAYLVLGRVGDARAALDKLPQDHAQRASLQERIGAAEQN
jgi:cytochrome c-type biogenesis protein CcmH